MWCPACTTGKVKVLETRKAERPNAFWRRRRCACGHTWETLELVLDDALVALLAKHQQQQPKENTCR